jgi:chloramphenicol-sensitive protein RarD
MDNRSARLGVLYGLAAYALWGVFPLYFHRLSSAGVTPWQILAHRIWWSCGLLAVIVTVQRRWPALFAAMRNRRTLLMLAASTLLIAINWLTFLIAVSSEQKLQASLGYFLTPLMNVLLGVTVLGERLRLAQMASVLLAGVGVVMMTIDSGEVPWIALILAISFAFYGLCRKTVAVDSLLGLTIETMLLAPLALVALTYWYGTGGVPMPDATTGGLLIFSGLATATPLLLFASAARRLRMVTIGFLQYVGPTIQFLLAVFVFHEPFVGMKVFCFGLIWLAIGAYCIDSLLALRGRRPDGKAEAPGMPLEDL